MLQLASESAHLQTAVFVRQSVVLLAQRLRLLLHRLQVGLTLAQRCNQMRFMHTKSTEEELTGQSAETNLRAGPKLWLPPRLAGSATLRSRSSENNEDYDNTKFRQKRIAEWRYCLFAGSICA